FKINDCFTINMKCVDLENKQAMDDFGRSFFHFMWILLVIKSMSHMSQLFMENAHHHVFSRAVLFF
ncbi:MAG TPA: hypothetical protein ACQGQI_07645, partial [Xylella sp.]